MVATFGPVFGGERNGGGGGSGTIYISTATDLLTAGQNLIGVNDTSVDRVITISSADIINTLTIGQIITINDESGGAGTNNILIETQGSETIDTFPFVAISVNFGSVAVYSDGTNLFTLGINTAFTPNRLVGLSLFLDASDTDTIIESGGAVSQWNDKSSNINNAIQGAGANQPMTGGSINGVNAITWDGSNDALIIPATPSLAGTFSTGGTIVFVSNAANGGGFPQVCNWVGAANISLGSGGGQIIFFHPFSGDNLSSRSPYGTGTPKIMTVTYNGDNVGNPVTSYRDGALLTQSSVNDPTGVVTVGTGEVVIGNLIALNRSFDGVFGEILIYNRILTDNERDAVHNYLSDKWGIVLV